MKTVRDHIEQQQATFATHPFFSALEREPSIERAMRVASQLTFWVMTFQDVLRLNQQLVTDPELVKIARHHRAEDAGHERWFLADMAAFQPTELGVSEVFGRAHAATRDAAYALISEVFRARTDVLRIVLVLTLESTGHVFFDHMARFVELRGYGDRLKYFSHHHLAIEQAHAVFEAKLEAQLAAIELSIEDRVEARDLIDRAYAAFRSMFDALVIDLTRKPNARPSRGLATAVG